MVETGKTFLPNGRILKVKSLLIRLISEAEAPGQRHKSRLAWRCWSTGAHRRNGDWG